MRYLGFVYALVVDFAYLLDFVGKSSYCEMVEIVAVFVCNSLAYMVQKCLVNDNHYHQMIGYLCNKVIVVYSCFVEKMGNFHHDPVEGVDYLENLLNLLMYLEDSNNENIRGLGFAYFFGGFDLFLIDVHNYSCVLQKCFL